jgi:hypothetical protein
MITEKEIEQIKDQIGDIFNSHRVNLYEMRMVLKEMTEDISEDNFKSKIKRTLKRI